MKKAKPVNRDGAHLTRENDTYSFLDVISDLYHPDLVYVSVADIAFASGVIAIMLIISYKICHSVLVLSFVHICMRPEDNHGKRNREKVMH